MNIRCTDHGNLYYLDKATFACFTRQNRKYRIQYYYKLKKKTKLYHMD